MQYHKLLLGALLGLFQFAFFPLLASAATSISGTLFFDTTWTSFGSPYVIDGQFIIPKGLTPGYWYTLRVLLDDGEVYETVVGIR